MVDAREAVRWIPPVGIGVLAALGTAALIGVPTDVIPNPWFGRQTPVHPYDVIVLTVLSAITGALIVTYAAAGGSAVGTKRAGLGSGVLGWFAVGCPVCNKIVVALLGASGATSTFAPLQPALGAAAIGLAGSALTLRVRALRRGACALPAPRADGNASKSAG
jgi:hypothetical protein